MKLNKACISELIQTNSEPKDKDEKKHIYKMYLYELFKYNEDKRKTPRVNQYKTQNNFQATIEDYKFSNKINKKKFSCLLDINTIIQRNRGLYSSLTSRFYNDKKFSFKTEITKNKNKKNLVLRPLSEHKFRTSIIYTFGKNKNQNDQNNLRRVFKKNKTINFKRNDYVNDMKMSSRLREIQRELLKGEININRMYKKFKSQITKNELLFKWFTFIKVNEKGRNLIFN